MTKLIRTDAYKFLVQQLKKTWAEANHTQVEVAKILNHPQSHISNIESGQQRGDVVELQLFAGIYQKDLKWFVK